MGWRDCARRGLSRIDLFVDWVVEAEGNGVVKGWSVEEAKQSRVQGVVRSEPIWEEEEV